MSHTDLFGRTTAFGLGTDGTWTYVWNGRDTSYANDFDSLFLVDGTRVVLPVNDWDSYTITGAAPVADGQAGFDFYVPVLADDTHYYGAIVLRLGSLTNSVTLTVDGSWNNPITDPSFRLGSANGDGESFSVFATIPVEPGNWYTAKVGWQSDGRSGYKLWKRSDPEPDGWVAVSITGEASSFADDWIDFWFDGDSEVSYLDNLTIDDTDPSLPNGQFSADAIITTGIGFCDTFTRSVTHGLGDSYVFEPGSASGVTYKSTNSSEAVTALSVDGAVVVAANTFGEQQQVYKLPYPVATTGYMGFDFYIPATWDYANSTPVWRMLADSRDRAHGGSILITAEPFAPTDFYVSGSTYNGGSIHAWTPSATDAWFTVKTVFNEVTGAYDLLIKPQGTDDSAAEYTESGTLATDNQGYTDELVLVNSSGTHPLLDNVCYLAEPYGFSAAAFFVEPTSPSFSAGAVLRRTQSGSFAADATVGARHFAAYAVITAGGPTQHYRDRDHQGTQDDTTVTLSSSVSSYPAGSTLASVLADLWSRTQ